jgi:hypothetical protein
MTDASMSAGGFDRMVATAPDVEVLAGAAVAGVV